LQSLHAILHDRLELGLHLRPPGVQFNDRFLLCALQAFRPPLLEAKSPRLFGASLQGGARFRQLPRRGSAGLTEPFGEGLLLQRSEIGLRIE
jgi:hypothetical protein